jgi:hypothetical protein
LVGRGSCRSASYARHQHWPFGYSLRYQATLNALTESFESPDLNCTIPSAERTLSATVAHAPIPSFLLFLRFIGPLNYLFSHRFSSRDDREKYNPKLFFIEV